MIQLKVNSCPNNDYLGKVQFFKNLIYIGSNLSSDLYLPDSEIKTNHLFIEVIENKLIAHAHKKVDYFWVNGKRTKSFKFLTIGDKIKIGSTEIEIVIYSTTTIKEKRVALNEAADILVSEKSDFIPLIQSLQEDI